MTVTSEAFGDVPVNHWLGFQLEESSRDTARVTMPVREEMLQEDRVVHGGILTALADTAAVYVLYPGLPSETGMTSVELKVNFLRPGLPETGLLEARATCVRRGRTVGLCDVEVFQQNRMVLKGLFTYLFFPRRKG